MIRLPQYTKRDIWIAIGMLPVFVILVNYLLFGKRYFSEASVFGASTVVTFIILAISWKLHTWVAVTLRNRFPRDREMLKRMTIAILLFIIMTGISLTILFWGYDYVQFMGYQLDETKYNWALASGVIINVFITVVHESVSSFEKWKTTLIETEQLKKEYMQSQLLGLKSQVSPHFLFNSLNSLSSLINEDPARAETFLDEMSKVYRYLLRSNEEQIVELETELQFLQSYFHLLKARYGIGVDLAIDVDEVYRKKKLPPLTLQILLDNVLKYNQICKDKPLQIRIHVNNSGWLEIRNNIQNRISDAVIPEESGLANVSNKFRLLCEHPIEIEEMSTFRTIRVPLISHEQIKQHESV